MENSQKQGGEAWEMRSCGYIGKVKKADTGWVSMIGTNIPIGAGFSKHFPTREEAIQYVTEWFSKKERPPECSVSAEKPITWKELQQERNKGKATVYF